MGDLRKFYSLSKISFVGRSLVPMGGSDMIESAALAKTTIFGPHTFNLKQSVEVLLAGDGAIEVQDENQLYDAIKKCLTDTQYAEKIAHNGQNVIRRNQGATKKAIEAVEKLLNRR
jgi:3-deoxy-D-manno-octulosonic-acid transferase